MNIIYRLIKTIYKLIKKTISYVFIKKRKFVIGHRMCTYLWDYKQQFIAKFLQ